MTSSPRRWIVYRPSDGCREVGVGSASRRLRASQGSGLTGKPDVAAVAKGLSRFAAEDRAEVVKGRSCDEKDERRAEVGRVLKLDGKDRGGGAWVRALGCVRPCATLVLMAGGLGWLMLVRRLLERPSIMGLASDEMLPLRDWESWRVRVVLLDVPPVRGL